MENTADIGSWPTEVLFSFFRSLDPLSLHQFSGVCKRWSQMSLDNELWRQFCAERWQNIPKESDCVKNWLIPVREGVGNKENRIDWRKVYLIRDLADSATLAMVRTMPKPSKKKGRQVKGARQSATKDFFEKGWIELKDLPALEEFFAKNTRNISEPEDYLDEMLQIMNFHLEFELLMLKQVNISRMKHLGVAAKFLEDLADFLKSLHDYAPYRFIAVLNQYFDLAVQKEVPLETAAKLVAAMTSVMSAIAGDYEGNMTDLLEELKDFFMLIVRFINEYPYGDAYNQWISTDFAEDETSPTHEFEESLNVLAVTMKDIDRVDELWQVMIESLSKLNPSTSLRAFNTVLAINGAVTESVKEPVLANLDQFAATYVLPFFRVDQSTPIEKLVPINYYFATTFSNLGSAMQVKFMHQLMPGIITMASVNHPRVQYHVGQVLLGFCEHLVDGEEGFGQYLPELLNKLYATVMTSTNQLAREKTIFAISSIVITCRNNFAEVRESVMTTFKNLLAIGNKKDREAVIEALSRIGAGVGDQKESIAGDVESLYAQVVEDFKNDRPAHEELLIKLTEFGVTTLGKKFSKYLPLVFPVIHQHAVSEVLNIPEGLMGAGEPLHENNNDAENNNEDDENDNEDNDGENDDEPEDEIDWDNPNLSVDEKQVSLKTSCVAALGNLVEDLDRAELLPYYEQIHEALRLNVGGQGTLDLILIASEIYVSFVAKFFPHGMEPEWVQKMKPFFMDITEAFLGAIETEELDSKERVLTSFNTMLEILIKNSPANQPFVDEDITNELLQACLACMEQLYMLQDLDIEDIHDYGYECVNLFEICAKNTANKKEFILRTGNFLSFVMNQCTQQGPSVSRWADLCILTTTFEYYGEYFAQYGMGGILAFLWSCRNVDSKYTQQAIAYYLSVYARKYSKMLPPDLQPIFDWLNTLLIEEYHRDRPYVYDNALLAYGYLVERTTQKELFMQRMRNYIALFPPTADGDTDEGNKCLETLARLLTSPFVSELLVGDKDLMALLLKNVKATLALGVYNTEMNRGFLDPIIALLEGYLGK